MGFDVTLTISFTSSPTPHFITTRLRRGRVIGPVCVCVCCVGVINEKEGERGVERRESSGSLCPHYSRVATQASMQAWYSLGLSRPTSGMCVCV